MFPGSSMVEHSAVNRRVASSNLARGAKFFRIVIIHKSLSTRYRIHALRCVLHRSPDSRLSVSISADPHEHEMRDSYCTVSIRRIV